jgi:catalase
VKWHFKPTDGVKTMDGETAARLAGTEPDYHVKDLFNAIEKGDYPTWKVYIQVMTPKQAQEAPIDIFDCTYTWPHKQYPLRLVGQFHLNKNVSTFSMSKDLHCPTWP